MDKTVVKKEAAKRGWRTTLEGAIAVFVIAVLAVLQNAFSSGNFNISVVGYSALAAGLTALVSYLYNRFKPDVEVIEAKTQS